MNKQPDNPLPASFTLDGLRRVVIIGLLVLAMLGAGAVVSIEQQFKKVQLVTGQIYQLSSLLTVLNQSELLLLRKFDSRLSVDLTKLLGLVEDLYLPFQHFADLAAELGQVTDISLAREAEPLVEELRTNIFQSVALLRFGEVEEYRQSYIGRTSVLIRGLRKFVDDAKYDKAAQLSDRQHTIDRIRTWLKWIGGAIIVSLLVLFLAAFKYFESLIARHVDKVNLRNLLVEKAQDTSLALAHQIRTQLERDNAELENQLGRSAGPSGQVVNADTPASGALKFYDTLDPLTNLYNRRFFDTQYVTELRRAQSDQRLISVMMVDIDNFKDINDSYGHRTGDECIRQVAELLRTSVKRDTDIVALYGGEEFVVLLQDTPDQQGRQIAEQIRRNVESNVFRVGESEIGLTVSIGFASTIPLPELTARMLLKRANDALYAAKERGRNGVVYSDQA